MKLLLAHQLQSFVLGCHRDTEALKNNFLFRKFLDILLFFQIFALQFFKIKYKKEFLKKSDQKDRLFLNQENFFSILLCLKNLFLLVFKDYLNLLLKSEKWCFDIILEILLAKPTCEKHLNLNLRRQKFQFIKLLLFTHNKLLYRAHGISECLKYLLEQQLAFIILLLFLRNLLVLGVILKSNNVNGCVSEQTLFFA